MTCYHLVHYSIGQEWQRCDKPAVVRLILNVGGTQIGVPYCAEHARQTRRDATRPGAYFSIAREAEVEADIAVADLITTE